MAGLLAISRVIDRVNDFVGKQISWLILAAVLISAANAISRKAFDISSNAWLELQWYLFGTVFMLAASYTLQRNEHIRIDIVSNILSKRTRDWIDLICHFVFLVPFVSLMVWLCWPWFLRSFFSGEVSTNAGGLIIWPAKFVILLGFILLCAQALSEIIKRIGVITGNIEDETPGHELPPTVEAALKMEGEDRA